MTTTPASVYRLIEHMKEKCGYQYHHWLRNFEQGMLNTLEKTLKLVDSDEYFVITGDIPAMWLRDSSAQVRPFLVLAKEDPEIAKIIKGVLKRQFKYIAIDPYANAFNETPNGRHHGNDYTTMGPWIWERKYEIDSLCYPVQLAYLYYKNTGDTSHFDQGFQLAVDKIIATFKTEQHHENSTYSFERFDERPEDTLPCQGKGNPVAYTGMIWSGFRPSDDACKYGYLVPSNMFAVVILQYLAEIYREIFHDNQKVQECMTMVEEINQGIQSFAIVKNQSGQDIYAYEVDGLGNHHLIEDPNVPSLLSMPYLGYCESTDLVYQNTRQMLLSEGNPYYYVGKFGRGLGSSHTPKGFIWDIALAIEALTSNNKQEKLRLIDLLVATDADTGFMHESFNVNDPEEFTRPWFSWANMMFCELVMDYFDIRVQR